MLSDYDSLRAYCLAKKSTSAGYPFGEGTLVLKVLTKMFALIMENSQPLRMNLKCNPEDAQALRAEHKAIEPGYHMNKEHWNTLILDGSLPDALVAELIDHSYDLVVQGMKKVDRERLSK
ncbi:MAG: MmcQ/YjbR family DNA-binding protein [Chloroflexi bacterium]|nr:MmcQ/YjbR family DNA-binding protein [Chloroflexota bacterium]